jgi:hypothetical protein
MNDCLQVNGRGLKENKPAVMILNILVVMIDLQVSGIGQEGE